jgi:hypothetical protein
MPADRSLAVTGQFSIPGQFVVPSAFFASRLAADFSLCEHLALTICSFDIDNSQFTIDN